MILFILRCIDISQKNSNSRGYTNEIGDFEISNCFFFRKISYFGDGSVIFVSEKDCNFSLFTSLFYYCSCDVGNSGAIYFYCPSKKTSVLLSKICAHFCFTSFNFSFQFSCFVSGINIDTKCIINFTSINKCSPFDNNGYDSLYLYGGFQIISNLNSSSNRVYENGGISSQNSDSLILNFSSFLFNNMSKKSCITISGTNSTFSYSNIIKNFCPFGGVVTFQIVENTNVIKCIFIENSYILFQNCDKKLVEIYFCSIDNHQSNSGNIAFFDLTKGIFPTYEINHFYTFYCQNFFDFKKEIKFQISLSNILIFTLSIFLLISFTLSYIFFKNSSKLKAEKILTARILADMG